MEESFEVFSKAALEYFGDKVIVGKLSISPERLAEINSHYESDPLTEQDFSDYGEQVWLAGSNCPECGVGLLGFFGSFSWDIQHGIGHYSNCDEVTFRYFHYIGKHRPQGFSIVGFGK